MGGITGPDLVAAVSNAGGLGILPVWGLDIATLTQHMRETRALSARPFGVNLNLAFPQEDRLRACLEEGPAVVSFFWALSEPMIALARDAGAVVMQTVSTAAEAKAAAAAGTDIVVAQGWEAGGHVRGSVATMALVPAVVDAVDIPVFAAGGIVDARGVAAVLALGASAAWIGTRFLLCAEATIHPLYRQALLTASEADTVHTTLFDIGWPDAPHRVLHGESYVSWEAAGRPPAGKRPREGEIVATSASRGPIERYRATTPIADVVGNVAALPMWAGQGVGAIRDIHPAAEIVRDIAAGLAVIRDSTAVKS
jgi:nitronate monooxygenase